MKKYAITKFDIILLVIFLLMGVCSFLIVSKPAEENAVVEIRTGGEIYETADLSSNKTIQVITEDGYNTVVISGGRVRVSDADCSGRDCVDFGWISKEGQVIMCLPHKLLVSIIKGGEIDAVVY